MKTRNFLRLVTLLTTLTICTQNLSAVPRRASTIVPGKIGTVLIFVSSMCPCTDQHRLVVKDLVEETRSQGIEYYCVFSNSKETSTRAEYFFRNIGWDMPYILDKGQKLADKYKASHTPQIMVMTRNGQPLFLGPIDDSSQNQGQVKHAYLKDCVNQLLSETPPQFAEVPPLGCWIVYDKDNIP